MMAIKEYVINDFNEFCNTIPCNQFMKYVNMILYINYIFQVSEKNILKMY